LALALGKESKYLAENFLPKSFQMRFRFFNFQPVTSSTLVLDPLTKNEDTQIPLIRTENGTPFSVKFAVND